jgi:drug/metabolite transporter (DMT)-like permease
MKLPTVPVTQSWGIRLAVLTAVISGFAVWLNATAVRTVGDPAVFTTSKNLIAAIVLITLAAAAGGAREARTLRRGQWGRLVIIGIIGGSLPFLLFFTGLSLATAPSAAFIHKTLFLWVAVLAIPFLGERLGLVQVAALSVLLVGQVLLVAPGVGGGIGLGEALVLAATLLWSIEVVVAKRVLAGVSPTLTGAARLGFGLVVLLGYLAVSGKTAALASLTAESAAWILVTGLILAGYVASWFAALRRAPAVMVTAVLVVGAVVTALLDQLAGAPSRVASAELGLIAIVIAAMVMAASAGRRVGDTADASRRSAATEAPRPTP